MGSSRKLKVSEKEVYLFFTKGEEKFFFKPLLIFSSTPFEAIFPHTKNPKLKFLIFYSFYVYKDTQTLISVDSELSFSFLVKSPLNENEEIWV